MSEKITLEAVLPIAAQVFNALPKGSALITDCTRDGKTVAEQYAVLFADFALTIHDRLTSSKQNVPPAG